MPKYVSPTGSPIVGTAEMILGTALISGISDDGTPEYIGETEIDWDSQTTAAPDGKTIYFVDKDGEQWTFGSLTRLEGDDDAS